jgi:16S rRNA (guanine966-N2)-methyltransferase
MAKVSGNRGVRIIAGNWRGRRLPVVDLPGLRPTGDRVKETLFNWLQADIRGSRCLDLFAGSGGLGLEAASRGADAVIMLEKNPLAVKQLQENSKLLGAGNVEIRQVDTLCWLEAAVASPFDVVFLDPPFESEWQTPVIEALLLNNLLTAGGLVYVESASRLTAPIIPAGLKTVKAKQLGEVRMQLLST